jgi:hypothetical protein
MQQMREGESEERGKEGRKGSKESLVIFLPYCGGGGGWNWPPCGANGAADLSAGLYDCCAGVCTTLRNCSSRTTEREREREHEEYVVIA